MATFYVLPPRPLVGERFADYLRQLFPGLDWSRANAPELAELLTSAAACHPDVYIVHREDLADGEDAGTALQHGYGAETGDEVVEVRVGVRPGELSARRWRLERG